MNFFFFFFNKLLLSKLNESLQRQILVLLYEYFRDGFKRLPLSHFKIVLDGHIHHCWSHFHSHLEADEKTQFKRSHKETVYILFAFASSSYRSSCHRRHQSCSSLGQNWTPGGRSGPCCCSYFHHHHHHLRRSYLWLDNIT